MLMAARKDEDLIPPEQRRRRKYVSEMIDHPTMQSFGGVAIKQRAIRKVSILDVYFKNGDISGRQRKAGKELADDYAIMMAGQSMTVDTTKVRVDGGYPGLRQSEAQQEAQRKYERALEAVGPIASREVCLACCEDEPVGKGAFMVILRRGLDVLAKHYGY